MDEHVLKGLIIGSIIGLIISIIKLVAYFKYGKELKAFNVSSLFAVFLGLLYGIKGDDD